MVEGDDRTDRSSACGGSSDDGCQPDGPEQLDRNQAPKAPIEVGAGTGNAFPAPRLTALDEVRQHARSQTLVTRTAGRLFISRLASARRSWLAA